MIQSVAGATLHGLNSAVGKQRGEAESAKVFALIKNQGQKAKRSEARTEPKKIALHHKLHPCCCLVSEEYCAGPFKPVRQLSC